MKTFKLKFKPFIIILAYLGVAVSATAFGLNLWRCIANGGFTDFYASLQYGIIFAVAVFAPVLLLCVVYHSSYTITDKEFITSFGFIKSKFPISAMTKVVLDKKTNRLAVYTGEDFMAFRLDEKWSQEFIDLLLSKNKKILYDEVEDFEKNKEAKDDEKDEKKKK